MTDYPFKPFPGSSHAWAIDQAQRLPAGPLRLLDVGAGAGHVLTAIRAARPAPVKAWAVEPTDAGGQIADAQWVRDLQDVDADGFDLALALDVLEHTADPQATLREITARLRQGGVLLVSVPNVAHWSMRASLLVGRFDYAERGILDRTHLRFFTRASLCDLIATSGLRRLSLAETIVPLELIVPAALTENALWAAARGFRRSFARMWPGLLAYQLLAAVSKP